MNQRDLEDEDRLLMKKLAEKNMFYRLKAVVVGTDGIRSTFLTASKAVSQPPRTSITHLINRIIFILVFISTSST